MKLKLDIEKHADGYCLWLPIGWCFDDDPLAPAHSRTFDSMKELRMAARKEVIPCKCSQCADAREGAR